MLRRMTLAALTALALSPVAHAQGTAPNGNAGGAGQGNTTTAGAGAQDTPRTGAGAQGSVRGGNAATTANQAAGATADQRPVSDQLFAPAAAVGGMAEVGISRLGAQKATDPELKKFSERMIDEHTRVNQQLMTLASGKRINLPTSLDARAAFCQESLAGLTGKEFDKCYAKAQLVAHMDSLALFEAEAQRGQDPEIKAFAAKVVPHIREHLETIKPIAKRYMDEEKHDGQHDGQHADHQADRPSSDQPK